MPASISALIEKGCLLHLNGNNTFKEKLRIIGSRYSTLKCFVDSTIDDYNAFKTVEGTPCFKPLTDKEIEAVDKFKLQIDPEKSIEENFISILTSKFINKQLAMLEKMSVNDLNANPMLCRALNFTTAEDLIRYNAYASISRSIVTSMGFLIQDLLLYSSNNVYDGKNFEEGEKTKFDIVVESLENVRAYIEVKSGPNDLDAAQVKHYGEEIKKVEEKGYKGYVGIAYGKRSTPSVSFGLFEQYLANWIDRTLIGQELWDFVTSNKDYHNILMNQIQGVADSLLGEESIVTKIENKVAVLTAEFKVKFKTLEDYYSTLW
jgi:hypothetical protein